MNQLTTMRWSFEQDVYEYAKAGFESIGVWRSKLSDVGERRGVELLRQHGLSVSNLFWAGGFTGSDGQSHRDAVTDAVEAIHTAAQLETDCLIIFTGSWGGHTKKHAHRLVRNALTRLLPHAEEFGVTLALEPMCADYGSECTFLTTLEETLELIDPLENPYLKLAFDTYHFAIAESPCLRTLEDIVDRIAVVHLGDGEAFPSTEQNRCRLGEGVIPNLDIIAVLKRMGYDGFLDVELMGEAVENIDYEELLQHSLRAMQGLVSELEST